ncbi:MAG: B12-binding domain-containing radical SAM protein [bacterium]
MKILLIQPPIRDFYTTSHRMYPLGLLYLASSLKAKGFQCELLDCFSGNMKRRIPLPFSLNYLKEFYPPDDKSPFRLFGSFYHFGLADEAIRDKIKHADIVGISALFTTYEGDVLRVAQIAKELGKVVILGGTHATVAAPHLLETPYVDYVILGEGERRLVALCQSLRGNYQLESIDGLGYKMKGRIEITQQKGYLENINTLPFPDRTILDHDNYYFRGFRYTMILASRGCPFGCSFCSSHAIMGKTIRFRSIENILEEMRICYKLYNIKVFDFEDDHFAVNRYRSLALLEAIEAEFGNDPQFRLLFENGLFPHSLDKELLTRMNKLGTNHLNLPLVTASYTLHKRLNRPGSPKSFAEIIRKAKGTFFITGYIILGIPGSDINEMLQSIRFLSERNVLIAPSIFYAAPGMEIYQQCKKKGWLTYDSFLPLRSSAFPLETDRFRRLDLVTLFRLIRALNFIKSLIDKSDLTGEMTLSKFIKHALLYAPELSVPLENLTIKSSRSLSPTDLGLIILSTWLCSAPAFYYLRKEKLRRETTVLHQWTYHLIQQKDSTRVWNQFFSIMNHTPIRGIHNTELSLTWDIE